MEPEGLLAEIRRWQDKTEKLESELARVTAIAGRLKAAIDTHRAQHADDRCWLDDLDLYAVLEDGVQADNRVGDRFAMARNCLRFIERRCQDGHWPSYTDLEAEITRLRALTESLAARCAGQSELLSSKAEKDNA